MQPNRKEIISAIVQARDNGALNEEEAGGSCIRKNPTSEDRLDKGYERKTGITSKLDEFKDKHPNLKKQSIKAASEKYAIEGGNKQSS